MIAAAAPALNAAANYDPFATLAKRTFPVSLSPTTSGAGGAYSAPVSTTSAFGSLGGYAASLSVDWGALAWSAAGSFAVGVGGAVLGGAALSAALASGTVGGGLAAAALIGYGAFSGAMALNDAINGATLKTRLDAGAGLLGGAIGGAWSAGRWWTSLELEFGPNLRLAPFGNRGVGHPPHPIGRYPHYHRRGVDAQGNTLPGQSLKRHRPLETKGTDTGFLDRF
jgi:hypothetical protein